MARNGSGTYTVPNSFVAGTTITASDHNENWSDAGTEITNSVATDGQTTMTGPLKASSGTAAVPSITFGADTDTGAYRKASNELGFATGGTIAGYFDSSQKAWFLGAADIAGAVNLQSTLAVTGAVTLSAALTGTALTLSGLLTLSSTSHMIAPTGTTAQRPGSPAAGHFRLNTTLDQIEHYNGSTWKSAVTRTPVILQVVSAQVSSASGTQTIPTDNTTPTVTEGQQVWTQSFTVEAGSDVLVLGSLFVSGSASAGDQLVSVFRDSTCIGVVGPGRTPGGDISGWMASISIVDAAPGAGTYTYQARVGLVNGTGGSWRVNETPNLFNAMQARSTMSLIEVA